MHLLKKTFLIVLLPLFAFTAAHKFYVSVTNVGYSEKDMAVQITSRIFIDDLEKLLRERYDIEGLLATENESKEAAGFIERYIRAKFEIEIDGKPAAFDFLGIQYDNDIAVCYIEVPKVDLKQHRTIQIRNEILTDMFDEQQNVLHFKINGQKKSYVLMKENNKGMLNL